MMAIEHAWLRLGGRWAWEARSSPLAASQASRLSGSALSNLLESNGWRIGQGVKSNCRNSRSIAGYQKTSIVPMTEPVADRRYWPAGAQLGPCRRTYPARDPKN